MKKYQISKYDMTVIKGICIITMLFHHLFTFPHWINYGKYIPKNFLVQYLNSPTKLCVCVFAFITGWAFCISNKKINDILNRITKFLLQYWLVLFFIVLFAVIVCDYDPSIIDIITEMFGISSKLMKFCWYVNFYIISILLLFLTYKLISKNIFMGIIIGIILPILSLWFLKEIINIEELQVVLNNLKHWYPCVTVGYICNEYNIFGIIKKNIEDSILIKKVILIFVIIFCGIFRYYISGLDFIYSAILVFSFSILIDYKKKNIFISILQKLGDASNNIWFLHCIIFSSVTSRFIQPYVYSINNEFIIIVIVILVLYVISMPLNKIDQKIKNIKIFK